jgi:integrase
MRSSHCGRWEPKEITHNAQEARQQYKGSLNLLKQYRGGHMRGDGTLFRIGKVWHINAVINGKRVRETTGHTNYQEARKWMKERLATYEPKNDNTLGEALDMLLEDYRLREIKSLYRQTSVLKAVKKRLGHRKVQSLTNNALLDYVKARRTAGKSNQTIIHDLQVVRQALTIAIEYGWISKLPTFPSLRKGLARQGFVDRGTFDRILTFLPEEFKDFSSYAYCTGWRRGDVANLTWKMVSWEERVIRLPMTKNDQPRLLPMVGEVWTIIHKRWTERVGSATHVFPHTPTEMKALYRAWGHAAKEAGVPDILFHDLRRSAVRDMVRAGVPDVVAMKISGHRTRHVFDRYNIVSYADVEEALGRVQSFRQRNVKDEG